MFVNRNRDATAVLASRYLTINEGEAGTLHPCFCLYAGYGGGALPCLADAGSTPASRPRLTFYLAFAYVKSSHTGFCLLRDRHLSPTVSTATTTNERKPTREPHIHYALDKGVG